MLASDHDIDCRCDDCWGPTPTCGCGASPSYVVGPSRTPLCARCMDRANTIRREIQAVHAVSTPRPKPHHPEDCPFATGDRRTWFYCEACDHDVPRAQLTLFSPPDKEDP